MCTSCGRRGTVFETNLTCCPRGPPQGRNIHDMIHDPCAKRQWHSCHAKIYGKLPDGSPCAPWCDCRSTSCRFPPKRYPPPPPPARNCCDGERCNPERACGFIVKPSNYPSGRPQCCPIDDGCPCVDLCPPGCGGCCSQVRPCISGVLPPPCCNIEVCCNNPCNPCQIPAGCSRSPRCFPMPDPCLLPAQSACAIDCRPSWKPNAVRSNPYCNDSPAPLPPRSFRYKCWLSQFCSKVDSNLCPSIYSSRCDRAGCSTVVVQPPDCGRCQSCPCHPGCCG